MILEPTLFRNKSVEIDLKNSLNPSTLLDDLFFKKNEWFGFQDFYKKYIELNEQKLKELYSSYYKNELSWESFLDGLKARIYRTQFGFLTEYHAFFMAKIVFGEDNVMRDVNLDKIGIDFQINFENNLYNIHIFVDSERAWYFRGIKSKYKNVDNHIGIHINLPYSLKSGFIHSLNFLPNRFGIYRKEYFEYLKQEIINGNIKDNNIVGIDNNGFRYQY